MAKNRGDKRFLSDGYLYIDDILLYQIDEIVKNGKLPAPYTAAEVAGKKQATPADSEV